MNDIFSCRLSDGRTLEVKVSTYPLSSDNQRTLISLWRTEWKKTDYDWLQSMHGDYSDTLKIQSLIGTVDGVPAGTATVNYPCREPDVAVNGSVLTHPDFRRLGIAAHLTNAISDLAFGAGCKVAYMGGERIANSVYLRCGYDWHNGGVLRRAAPGCDDCEEEFFAPGQKVTLRPAAWGDMSGFACLVVQPLDSWVLDYPRGYLSGKHVSLKRCVSNFPNLYDQVTDRGGVVNMLIGEATHRVLGFGSLTPGPSPARQHKAVVDVAVHDHYVDCLPDLIEKLKDEAPPLEVQTLQTFVADPDQVKKECFLRAGFQPVAELPGQLNAGNRKIKVTILEIAV